MQLSTLRKIRVASLVLICTLAGIYAGNFFWAQTREAPPVASRLDASPALESVPDFSLPDLNGELQNLTQWTDRPLLINFWATWCAPCRREMPLLETLHQERGGEEFAVIGIAIDRLEDVTAYIPESGITYPILVGQTEATDLAYLFDPDFTAMPFTVFTAPGGRILTLFTGELHPGQLRAILAIADDVAAGRITVDEGRRLLAAADFSGID